MVVVDGRVAVALVLFELDEVLASSVDWPRAVADDEISEDVVLEFTLDTVLTTVALPVRVNAVADDAKDPADATCEATVTPLLEAVIPLRAVDAVTECDVSIEDVVPAFAVLVTTRGTEDRVVAVAVVPAFCADTFDVVEETATAGVSTTVDDAAASALGVAAALAEPSTTT